MNAWYCPRDPLSYLIFFFLLLFWFDVCLYLLNWCFDPLHLISWFHLFFLHLSYCIFHFWLVLYIFYLLSSFRTSHWDHIFFLEVQWAATHPRHWFRKEDADSRCLRRVWGRKHCREMWKSSSWEHLVIGPQTQTAIYPKRSWPFPIATGQAVKIPYLRWCSLPHPQEPVSHFGLFRQNKSRGQTNRFEQSQGVSVTGLGQGFSSPNHYSGNQTGTFPSQESW